jgi:hypothetical protein
VLKIQSGALEAKEMLNVFPQNWIAQMNFLVELVLVELSFGRVVFWSSCRLVQLSLVDLSWLSCRLVELSYI